MKNIFLKILIVIGIIFLLLKGIEWRIETNFEARINSKSDRAYNITYQDLDLHTFFKGVTLYELRIQPLNKTGGTVITGNVDYATLKGLTWKDFLFSKRLNIKEMSFEQPVFEITLSSDTIKKTSGKGMQEMFGDILSRVDVNSFKIKNGSVVLKEPKNGHIKVRLKK